VAATVVKTGISCPVLARLRPLLNPRRLRALLAYPDGDSDAAGGNFLSRHHCRALAHKEALGDRGMSIREPVPQGILDTIEVECLVVGGGIAGCWTALKLQSSNVKTALIYYSDTDRGGKLGATLLSAGAINTSPLTRSDYRAWVEDLGLGQVQDDVCRVTQEFLREELEELQRYDSLKPVNLGVALQSGSGRHLVQRLLDKLRELGVVVIDKGWVVKLDASESHCNGVQYQAGNKIGAIVAGSMVIASGGYSSLFHGAVKAGTYGSIHGRFLEAGGYLSNTEFVFKHGYGQPDCGKLTPTEELPGAEIYDDDHEHLHWLERELFLGRGTTNHFQAHMTWRKNGHKKYYVDFRYRDFHRELKSKLSQISKNTPDAHEQANELIDYAVQCSSAEHKEKMRSLMLEILSGDRLYDYDTFCDIKEMISETFPPDKSRIRQIAYFSMGGIMHHRFRSNLKNVFVSGEAMHDFGAHRVGGLPWALYLCSARVIASQVVELKHADQLKPGSFALIERLASFDHEKLNAIQVRLQEYHETGLESGSGTDVIHWIRQERARLKEEGKELDDIAAYLLVAEAIMTSSLERCESRGCFLRHDYTSEDANCQDYRTIAALNTKENIITAQLIHKARIQSLIVTTGDQHMQPTLVSEYENAAYVLLKKHKDTEVWQRVAVETSERSLTYAELNELVEKYASYLSISGVTMGDRVALLLDDSPELIALFLACLQTGIIAVPLNTFSKDDDLVHYLRDSQAKLLIAHKRLWANCDSNYIRAHVVSDTVCVEDISIESIVCLASCTPVGHSTPGFILYTSGSIGLPKGALHRQVSLARSAETFASSILQIAPHDRLYSTSKIFFAYGLGNSITFPLYYGATALLSEGKVTGESAVTFIQRKKPSVLFSVPALYKAIVSVLEQPQNVLPHSLRLSISAGEALPGIIAKTWFEKTRVPLLDGIGSTEALHIFCTSNTSAAQVSHGIPVDGYELNLVDDNGLDVADNVVANLVVKGPTLAIKYWGKEAEFETEPSSGWLKTGDLYYRDDRKQYVFVGRNADTYKSNGLWVSALEVENCIREVAFVEDAAVVVSKGREGFFEARAYVATMDAAVLDKTGAVKQIVEHLRTRLASYKQPHSFDFVDSLPRTATGKVAKSKLREMASAASVS
jgi:acyl-coenzyme A synthetase/AMP-(fatty) acid ligase/succinate dehydrogenase/fumarate reductase flavoprotein subunit